MQRIVICAAAGRDFHNCNTVCRDDAIVGVMAFTATQILSVDARRYPAGLTGALCVGVRSCVFPSKRQPL